MKKIKKKFQEKGILKIAKTWQKIEKTINISFNKVNVENKTFVLYFYLVNRMNFFGYP